MQMIPTLAKVGAVLSKNSPSILTAMGSVGVVVTAVTAVKATPKALRIIKEEEELVAEKLEIDKENVRLSPQTLVRLSWRTYLPSVLMGGATIMCIVGAHTIHLKRSAALLSAYTLTTTALQDYKNAVIKEVGDKKNLQIEEDVARTQLEKTPPSETLVMSLTDGDTLCYDTLTGRYFKSNIETIRAAQNDINEIILNDSYASQNEFYDRIGLDPAEIGEELGWSMDHKMRLVFSSHLSRDNKPCLAISYQELPEPKYYKFQ